MKRGQVTIFVILGILIVSVLVLLLTLSVKKNISEAIPPQVEPIKLFVEQCIQLTAEEAIVENSKQGGYLILPKGSTKGLFENLPYYYKIDSEPLLIPDLVETKQTTELQTTIPSDEILASEIAQYVDVFIYDCLDRFSIFQERGYNVTFSKSATRAIIDDEYLTLKTTFPLIIRYGNQETSFSSFSHELSIPELIEMIAIAQEITDTQSGNKLCLSCISNLVADSYIFVDIITLSENTTL